MFKVVIIVSAVAIIPVLISQVHVRFQPYYIYSFDKDFDNYAYATKSMRDLYIPRDAYPSLIFQYEDSGLPGAAEYISNLQSRNMLDWQIVDAMRKDGKLGNVSVKDIEYNFHEAYYFWMYMAVFAVLYPLIWYLVASQVVYRTIAYIVAGKRNDVSAL